jgi:hypothetical protein
MDGKRAPATTIACIGSDALQQGRFNAALFVMDRDFSLVGLEPVQADERADLLPGALDIALGQQPLETRDYPPKGIGPLSRKPCEIVLSLPQTGRRG